MISPRLVSLVKRILYESVKVGVDEAGTRVCGSGWPYVKAAMEPLVEELQRRYPKLFFAGADGEQAADALSKDAELQGLLTEGFQKLNEGQKHILKVLADQDETLQEIGQSLDRGFREANQRQEEASNFIVQELRSLKLMFAGAGLPSAAKTLPPGLSTEEIFREANSYQLDAMRWISARDARIASQRLDQGRELLVAGLEREPGNADLLASLG
jgi:hypothetical protein